MPISPAPSTVEMRPATFPATRIASDSPSSGQAMRLLCVLALAALPLASLSAQQHGPEHAAHHALTAEQKEVLAVVERLFEGMRTHDTAMMRSTLLPDVRLMSVSARDGQRRVVTADVNRWIAGAGAATEKWDERLVNPEVRVDDTMATVWTGYTFHVGERFSHCGYDAFQLARTADGWKIVHIMDTQRREGCPQVSG